MKIITQIIHIFSLFYLICYLYEYGGWIYPCIQHSSLSIRWADEQANSSVCDVKFRPHLAHSVRTFTAWGIERNIWQEDQRPSQPTGNQSVNPTLFQHVSCLDNDNYSASLGIINVLLDAVTASVNFSLTFAYSPNLAIHAWIAN